jgi:hypothetical protein
MKRLIERRVAQSRETLRARDQRVVAYMMVRRSKVKRRNEILPDRRPPARSDL